MTIALTVWAIGATGFALWKWFQCWLAGVVLREIAPQIAELETHKRVFARLEELNADLLMLARRTA